MRVQTLLNFDFAFIALHTQEPPPPPLSVPLTRSHPPSKTHVNDVHHTNLESIGGGGGQGVLKCHHPQRIFVSCRASPKCS